MNKMIKKSAIYVMAMTMIMTALPVVSFANESDDILSYNKSILDDKDDVIKNGYDIKNDWIKLKIVKSNAPLGLNNMWQFLDEGGNDPIGFLVPEKLDLSRLDGFSYQAGSLGITGSEVEKFKDYAKQAKKTETYKKVKYPESDMSIGGESKGVYRSTTDDLLKNKIDVKSDLSPFKAWEEFAYVGDTSPNKTNFCGETYLTLELPEGLSYTSSDIKNSIEIKNKNYEIESVTVKGKEATIKLVKKILGHNITDFEREPDDFLDVDLSVGGIKYESSAILGKTYTIKGYIYGLMDNYKEDPNPTRAVNVFATRQSDIGKDKGSDLGHIMSITVGIKSNTITFKDGNDEKKVLVETGKSVDDDIDKTQSMPRNPSKDGYTFVGWNTKEDGTGTTFTGKTTVNKDITVYAIYEKNIVPRPRPDRPYTPVPGRVDGDDRIETAIKISRKYYDKANTVIVVRHDLFPDSMTASVLARLKDAPILLNPTAKLDPRVGKEITRLGAKEVIIVGGENSVSERVREELKPYDADKNVERISGHDRYSTSEMVARRVVGITGKKNVGVVASGELFPDALAVGTFASRDGYPILLVKKNTVPVQIARTIKDLNINKTYIAGGVNTISKSTEAKLPSVIERMAGQTRYDTALAIARSKFANSKEAFVASGEEFADALAISPISGMYNRPTLLVSSNHNRNKTVKKYIRDNNMTYIIAVGGQRYIPNSVLYDLVNLTNLFVK
ncbi:repeat protein [Peptostreptococcus anaerobius 653-L]|uniref:Repeat protein n=1 Tax=Peptostreptococcus anaerobius 653-L TaxID=596329 RepID=D3MPU1_9FIRM|nr:cell wall-binding repeat-containing protein [Peptostreptococcus anaerobius]EFD05849.1 repeat protein [Peptostreptococcus anaerobius 653-L]